ncbi:MAG: biopolymer transporter ExbD [Thermoanaerobaculia bacterium]
MQVGGSGTLRSDINITPLIDVILVLLIIFMVITPVVQMGYLVKVPPKPPPGQVVPPSPDQIVFRLTKEGNMFINKEQVSSDMFPQRVQEILKGNSSKMVFFSGDSDAKYEDVMKFLDTARAAGAKNIGIIVENVETQAQTLSQSLATPGQ